MALIGKKAEDNLFKDKMERQSEIKNIEDFKKQKNPRSAIEMATLVAYYLMHLAPERERKKTINVNDLKMYFKMAGYKAPKLGFTLVNAKNAGYLDSVEKGEYSLNPVGYNLVVHSLPRAEKSPSNKARSKRTRSISGAKRKGKK
jgi:hypothetical protein